MIAMGAVQYSDAVPWAAGAGVAFVLWCVLLLVVVLATMPTLPTPGPETMELGPEAPAVVNLLVNRCKLTTSAVSATLVDLATREHLGLEPIGGGEHLVRLRRENGGALRAYEKQLMQLVHERSHDGTVPTAELSLGYGNQADDWWKQFDRAVVADAQSSGFVRSRFTRFQTVLLAVALLPAVALAAVALELVGAAERAAGNDMDPGIGIGAVAVAWILASIVGAKYAARSWRETADGDAVAARWLGVGELLRRNDSFQRASPEGVVVWNQLLAYGVALGAAHEADAALPIGPTRDDEGWSPQRGLWRQLHITYPKRFGYGAEPRRAALTSTAVLVGAVAVLVILRDFIGAVVDLAGDALTNETPGYRVIAIPMTILFLAPLVVGAAYAVHAAITLRRAVADLRRVVTFEGYVMRVPWHLVEDRGGSKRWVPRGYTAVDDGRTDLEIKALRYYDPTIKEGHSVRVTMTPALRHVVRMEAVRAESPSG